MISQFTKGVKKMRRHEDRKKIDMKIDANADANAHANKANANASRSLYDIFKKKKIIPGHDFVQKKELPSPGRVWDARSDSQFLFPGRNKHAAQFFYGTGPSKK